MRIRGKTFRRFRRSLWQIPLVALLCLSLIAMGGLFWVSNGLAFIPDRDPKTFAQIGPLLEGQFDGGLRLKALDYDHDGVIPIAGGILVQGNGDQDDNKEEAFFIKPLTGQIVALTTTFKAVSNFKERRTVSAYKDFGHLKVMPDAEAITIPQLWLFDSRSTSVLSPSVAIMCVAEASMINRQPRPSSGINSCLTFYRINLLIKGCPCIAGGLLL